MSVGSWPRTVFRLVATFTRRKYTLPTTHRIGNPSTLDGVRRMTDGKDIGQLVKRLRDLQLEQASIIQQLKAVANKQSKPNTSELSKGDKVKIITKVKPPAGSRPSRRDTVGTILSITPTRIKVRTESGVTTYRAPHNVSKIQE